MTNSLAPSDAASSRISLVLQSLFLCSFFWEFFRFFCSLVSCPLTWRFAISLLVISFAPDSFCATVFLLVELSLPLSGVFSSTSYFSRLCYIVFLPSTCSPRSTGLLSLRLYPALLFSCGGSLSRSLFSTPSFGDGSPNTRSPLCVHSFVLAT